MPLSIDTQVTEYVTRWNLTPDGNPITTPNSELVPVRFRGLSAMLKIATEAEESFGGGLMVWWNGDGAACVYAHDGPALLMERAMGQNSLAVMTRSGRDDDACRILCQVAARLHVLRNSPPVTIPLADRFQELWPMAERGGVWTVCAQTARELLATQSDEVILHGDLHHGNVLDFGERGWRAIDPKGLGGERGFEFAALFLNPDFETASAAGRVARRAEVIAEAAGLDKARLLRWVLAFAGLSAAWSGGTGEWAENALAIAAFTAAELGQHGGH